ncbi:MAG: hypothetical protein L0191_17085, partial [Acidobacteria bacterium]|nr:hypothetical protein [Acidobacteriota bacterium]
GLFRSRTASSDHLAYRFAVIREERDGPSEATWVARRETSSWLEARCGAKILRADYGRSEFQVREDAFGFELAVASERGQEFYLRAESCAAVQNSLFPGAQALEDFLDECGSVRPHDVFHPEADDLDLDKSFAPEPLVVFEARSAFFADPALFPPGSTELDSAWKVVSRRLEVAPERARARLGAMLERGQSSPAMPTI